MGLAAVVFFLLSESTILGYLLVIYYACPDCLFCYVRYQVEQQGSTSALHCHDHPVHRQCLLLGLV